MYNWTVDAPPSRTGHWAETPPAHLEALQAGFAAREAWAFEAAYREFRRFMYGAALSILRDGGEAEDCVHDVLLRLWRSGNSYTQARGSLGSFLTVCVRNEALSRRRKAMNRLRIAGAEHSTVSVADAEIDRIGERDRMDAALATLSQKHREVIALAYYDGLTHEDIAQRLGEPVGTIKSRISNALRGLRGNLSEGER